jgi:acylphosphatase
VTDQSETRRHVQLVIRGRVQGVSFRAWAVSEAERRGLHGWVRNRADGSVEALMAGRAEEIDAMIDACRNGPPLAVVTDVIALDTTETPAVGFHIRT